MARRKPQGRKVKPVYYVFCEGETEEEYVKFLKQHFRIPIEVNTTIRTNISDSYISKYKRNKPTHPKDRTFVMFDLDKEDTKNNILNLNAERLCSNPSIELWFLLHFKNHTRNISTKDVIQALVRKYPNYKKGKRDDKLFEKLLSKKDDGITRAKRLTPNNNPSTTVYELIELMEK